MTDTAEAEEQQTYNVVLNDEEQYSIWSTAQELPAGWRLEGTTGTEAECLSHIDTVWTDMRPLSLRRYMEEHADDEPAEDALFDADAPSLVDRLCERDHPVEASLRPEASPAALAEAIARDYVFIRFTGTEGGTELGLKLDRELSRLSEADFAAGTGRLRIVGTLNLDFEDVRCTADLDLATLAGTGRLERVGDC